MPLSLPASHPSRPHFTILQKIQQTDLLLPIFSISIPVWSLSMGFGQSFAKLYSLAAQTPSSCSVPCFPILGNGFSLHPECHKSLTNICAQDCTKKRRPNRHFSSLKFLFFIMCTYLGLCAGTKMLGGLKKVSGTLKMEWQAVLSCPVWVLGTERRSPGESSQCS